LAKGKLDEQLYPKKVLINLLLGLLIFLNSHVIFKPVSSGKFVGIVADDPNEKIELKMFHTTSLNDAEKLSQET
jgi:hypothetical protein